MDLSTVVGWPAVIISIVIIITGLIRKQTALLVLGTVITLPFTIYLSGAPRFGMFIFILTASLIGAIIAMRRGFVALSWFLVSPYIVFVLWLVKELFL